MRRFQQGAAGDYPIYGTEARFYFDGWGKIVNTGGCSKNFGFWNSLTEQTFYNHIKPKQKKIKQ
jgi:hypothetical protein